MGSKHTYQRRKCHICGKFVAENWMIRHLKDNCQSGKPYEPVSLPEGYEVFKPGKKGRKPKGDTK